MFKDIDLGLEDYIDWGFVRTIFATRELTMNLDTRRKQIYIASYLFVLLVIGLLVFQRHSEIGKGLEEYIRYTLLALAFILYGTEPFVLILQTLVFQHPAVDSNALEKEDTSQIALVISCHKSADVIVRTCEGKKTDPTVFLFRCANRFAHSLVFFVKSRNEAFASRTNICHGQCDLFGSS